MASLKVKFVLLFLIHEYNYILLANRYEIISTFLKFFRKSKTLHFYDDEDIDRLNLLLGKQNSFDGLTPAGKQNGSSEAVWFVYIPNADESYLENVFRRTPLRLDSHVYALVQGKQCLLTTMV